MNDVFYVPSLSANLLSVYQISHSGSGKIVELTPNLVFIWDSMIGGIVTTRIVDLSTRLYSFSHFGPPLLENESPPLREHHVVQSGCLNLYVVPKTTIVTTLPPPLEIFSVQQSSSLALPDPPTPFIEPLGVVVKDSTEEIHLLFDDSVCTLVIPLTLGIPFQDPHVYSFEHHLSLLVTP